MRINLDCNEVVVTLFRLVSRLLQRCPYRMGADSVLMTLVLDLSRVCYRHELEAVHGV